METKPSIKIFLIPTILFAALFALAGDAKAERFFQKNSTWYEKIPANPVITLHSVDFVNEVLNDSETLGAADNMDWGYPIYQATVDSPIVNINIQCSYHAECETLAGWNLVPIPAGALPAGNAANCAGEYRDGNMIVISHDRKYTWDFFGAEYCNGVWSAWHVRKYDTNGTGINCPDDGCGNPSSTNASLLHLTYTYDEVANNTIDHAVAFIGYAAGNGAYSNQYYPNGIYPTCTGNAGINTNYWALPTGMRFQLDPAVNCDSLNLTIFGKRICKALQEYGMIVSEGSSRGNEYVMADAAANWGNQIGSLSAIPLDKLRVVEPVCSDCSICPNCVTADTIPPAAPSGLTVN